MLKLILLLIVLEIFSTECTPRNYKHPEMCKTKGSADCSFQVGDQENGACTLYNTTQCADFDFSGWMRQSSKHPAAQSDSIYTVDMIPYAFTTTKYQGQIYPAVNIVFTTSNKDVDGYILQIENSEIAMNICRIFDFRNSSTKNNTRIFFDCFVSLRHKGVHEFEMKVRALPHNEEMMYTISLPEAQSTETRDSSQWEPLVMVFNGGLKDNIVEVKFSQAPQHLNISSYQVSVLPTKSDVPVQTITVEATGDALLNTRFLNVDRGFYSICIRPFSSTSSRHCDTARYTVFYVENKLPGKIIIIQVVAVCFAGIVVVIAVVRWLWWLFKPGSITIKPVVLLVYSYDCKEHDVAVLRYAKFLENQGGIKVLTIYGEQRSDPDLWLFSPYRNCDIVMVILSEGVFHKCENSNNPAMEEGYPCGDRLIPALSFLKTKILDNEKNFIQVYFEYSGTCHAPSFMQSGKWGKTFVIPRKMNRLLCHVYNQNPKIACLGVYPRMPGHDVISSPEGSMLIESVEEMKQVLLKNDGVLQTLSDFTTKPEINRRHILPTVEKDRLRSTESESRHPENWSPNEGKKCNSIQNVPSKKLCSSYYNEGHMSDEENCVHSHLLPESSSNPCSVAECTASEDIGKNSAPDMLHNTEISANQHLEDLKVILLKPGPSFPYLNSLNLSK